MRVGAGPAWNLEAQVRRRSTTTPCPWQPDISAAVWGAQRARGLCGCRVAVLWKRSGALATGGAWPCAGAPLIGPARGTQGRTGALLGSLAARAPPGGPWDPSAPPLPQHQPQHTGGPYGFPRQVPLIPGTPGSHCSALVCIHQRVRSVRLRSAQTCLHRADWQASMGVVPYPDEAQAAPQPYPQQPYPPPPPIHSPLLPPLYPPGPSYHQAAPPAWGPPQHPSALPLPPMPSGAAFPPHAAGAGGPLAALTALTALSKLQRLAGLADGGACFGEDDPSRCACAGALTTTTPCAATRGRSARFANTCAPFTDSGVVTAVVLAVSCLWGQVAGPCRDHARGDPRGGRAARRRGAERGGAAGAQPPPGVRGPRELRGSPRTDAKGEHGSIVVRCADRKRSQALTHRFSRSCLDIDRRWCSTTCRTASWSACRPRRTRRA